MMNFSPDVAVIGGGPAGLAAALSAREAGASVLLMERDQELGGILQQCIHNGFGLQYFKEELTGPEYAARFIEKVYATDIDILTDTMVLSIGQDKTITAVGKACGLAKFHPKAIILAMGCRERTRGAINIPGTRPAGVYTAGCAQRLMNMEGMRPGRRIVILGSGDIGLIMARRMTWEGAKVELVAELMPYSSGLNRNIVQCLKDNDIPLFFNTTVTKIHGRERVEGVSVAEVDENRRPKPETERFVPCDTLLLSVGLIPENELTGEAGIVLDRVTSGAVVDQNRQTSLEGVFACGNVLHVHDLVDNVSAEAQLAGRAAADYVKNGPSEKEAISVSAGKNVGYVVPQRITAGETGSITLYFRVRSAIRPAVITVQSGGETVLSRKKQIVTPGEMEHVVIDASKLSGPVQLFVEEA